MKIHYSAWKEASGWFHNMTRTSDKVGPFANEESCTNAVRETFELFVDVLSSRAPPNNRFLRYTEAHLLRLKSGLDRAAFAKACDIHMDVLSRHERGITEPGKKALLLYRAVSLAHATGQGALLETGNGG